MQAACPGKMQRSTKRLAALAAALFANAFSMANPFPYSPFLVLRFGLTDDKREVGFYAGFIIGVFMLGRIVGSYPLGALSDTWGRRPVIEMGLLVACIILQTGFALSPTFGLALAFRFLMGCSNGIIGVAKAWLPEIAPPAQQAVAMSMISGMWGVGNVAGPALGGLLYAREAPAGSLLHTVPQLLPNLVGVIFAVAALAGVRAYLPGGGPGTSAPCATCCSRYRRRPQRQSAGGQNDGTALVTDDSAKAAAAELEASDATHAAATAAASDATHVAATAAESDVTPPPSGIRSQCCGVPRSSYGPLFAYCLLSFFSIIYNETYPLWLVAPVASGGLGWTPAQIGTLMSASGAFVATSNFVVFPLLSKRLSPATLFNGGCAICVVVYAVTPLLGRLHSQPTLLLPLLLAHAALKEGSTSTAFTAVFLIINSSCSKAQRGKVNGMGMSLSSAFKAAGPALGAMSFAWSLTNGLGAPFNVHFTFLMAGGVAAMTLVVGRASFASSSSTGTRRVEQQGQAQGRSGTTTVSSALADEEGGGAAGADEGHEQAKKP